MYKRPHHQRIAKILSSFDAERLSSAECYFGGGTAIVLSLGEYRESIDIDFLCSSNDGYRLLRNTVSNELGSLLKSPLKHLRDVRADRDAIRTVIEIDGQPIKVEFLKEGNSPVTGAVDAKFGVPTLSRNDMFTQKLLANADRGLDKATSSRDIIDLSMMIHHWKEIPQESIEKAKLAYGDLVIRGLNKSIEFIQNRTYLADCLDRMKMDPSSIEVIYSVFEQRFEESLKNALIVAQAKGGVQDIDLRKDQVIKVHIIDVTAAHVVLSFGRSATVVAQSDLSRVPAIGEEVSVKVKDGKGIVSDFTVVKTVGHGR